MATNRHSRRPRPLDTLDPKQAGMLLGLLPTTLARQAREGRIKVIKVGKLNRYPAEEVRQRVKESNTQAVTAHLLEVLEKLVEDNNAAIAREAARAGRKD